jgi:hypothetical protein
VAHARGNPREPDAATPEASASASTADNANAATTDNSNAATTTDNPNAAATTADAAAAAAATTSTTTTAAATTRGLGRVGANRHDKAGHRKRADRISDEQRRGRQHPSQIFTNHLIASKFFLRQWKLQEVVAIADTRVTFEQRTCVRARWRLKKLRKASIAVKRAGRKARCYLNFRDAHRTAI